jgi:low temperature requirement protein LtrA
MGEAVKMPVFKLPKIALPRPQRWDWIAIGTLVIGIVLLAANLAVGLTKPPEQPFPSGLTMVFVLGQLVIACGGLMLLGKTAKEGTGWGNAASLLATFVGISGVLLAAAFWAAA